jgi:hypothetical protein
MKDSKVYINDSFVLFQELSYAKLNTSSPMYYQIDGEGLEKENSWLITEERGVELKLLL